MHPATGNPIIVGIAGPSAAGKTTIVQELKKRIPHLQVISLDDFWKDSGLFPSIEVMQGISFKNWELPENLDFDRLCQALRSVRGRAHLSRGRRISHGMAMPRVIIVEGFLLLYDKRVRDMLDLKLYLDIDDDTVFSRRMERKRYVFEGMDLYYREVAIKEYRKYGLPTRKYADIIIDATAPLIRTVDYIVKVIMAAMTPRFVTTSIRASAMA